MFNPKRLNRWVEDLSHEPESENEKQKRHEKLKKTNRKNKKRYQAKFIWKIMGGCHGALGLDRD
jgi:hypothetical protein